MRNVLKRWAVNATLMLAVAASLLPYAPIAAQPITIQFKDADIDAVIGAFGKWLNKTFVVDPRVRGKISLETPRPMQPAEAYLLLQTALRQQGFAIVEAGGIARVVPEADAKLQAGPVSVGNTPSNRGEAVITQVFRVNYESASNLVPVLKSLMSPNSAINAVPSNNTLVVTDYAANIARIGRLLATLDSPSTNEVEVIPIKNAVASDIAVMVSRLLDDSQRGAPVDPGQRVLIFSDPRLNAIMIRAGSPAKLNLAKSLIARLDQPNVNAGNTGASNVNVVYLRYANALKLAEVLRSTLQGGGATDAATVINRAQPATPTANAPNAANLAATAPAAPQPSATSFSAGGATIAADPATNSLVITAPEAVYRSLRGVIDRLDARRAQIYIETLIVEITAENAAEFGIQWTQFGTGRSGNINAVGGVTSGGAGTPGSIVRGGPDVLGAGLNIGILRGLQSDPTKIFDPTNLLALIKALESQSRVNILSTPTLMAIDNEEAKITIGQNVPFISGQFTNTGGNNPGAVNPFQTIERRDVGITLRVRPQVGENGTIRMNFFLESSSLASFERAEGVITNVRTIDTPVYAEDGQIVVLGGLIEDRSTGDEGKVPGLGNVPILGHLFRSESRRRDKTNLLVFMRPVILRNPDAIDTVTADRYDYMRQTQGNLPISRHWLLPDASNPVLPLLPPRAPGPAQSTEEGRGADPALAPGGSTSIAPAIREQRGAPIQVGPSNSGQSKTTQVSPSEVHIQLPASNTLRRAPIVQMPQLEGEATPNDARK